MNGLIAGGEIGKVVNGFLTRVEKSRDRSDSL
jgi:hypothetical protein